MLTYLPTGYEGSHLHSCSPFLDVCICKHKFIVQENHPIFILKAYLNLTFFYVNQKWLRLASFWCEQRDHRAVALYVSAYLLHILGDH